MTLPATLTLTQAAQRTWGAVVVGAGPAGATAARELARRSVSVLLVDRASFPRWKVCGCCLNGRAMGVLRAVGLADLLAKRCAVPLESIHLAAAGRHATVALSGGAALSREAFDAALIEAAVEAGAAFLPETRAILAKSAPTNGIKGAPRPLLLQQGESRTEVCAQIILAADGLGSPLLAHTGAAAPAERDARIGAGATTADAPDFYRPGIIYMTCGAGGYTGLVRLEDGRLDMAAAFDAAQVRAVGGPGAVAARLIREAGWPSPDGVEGLPWRGTPALTRRARRLAVEGVIVLGDAAGYVEPFTGEGMAWALASGAAVAPLASRAAKGWRPEMARQWAELHRRVVGRRQIVCRVAATVLRRPLLTRLAVHLMAYAPRLAAPVIRCLNR